MTTSAAPAGAPATPPVGRAGKIAIAIIAAGAIVRLLFAAILPVFPDEAYYWTWSRHLAAGYFDHPPVIAWLIRLGGLLAPAKAGATPLAVRFGPVVAGFVAALCTLALTRRLSDGDERAALRASLILTAMPLAAAGLVLATPDAPLLATTALTLYAVARALLCSREAGRERMRWWVAVGIALGLAFSSKYTSILIPAGITVALVVHPRLRWHLRTPGPYLACVVATMVFLPVLWWNAHHGWISFAFQLHHGLAAPENHAVRKALQREGDFLGGQAGLASPILFVMLVIAVARALRIRATDSAIQTARFVLAVVVLCSFGLFVYSALRQRVEPNWPSASYIPAIALLASTGASLRWRRWLWGGVALAAALSLVVYVQGIVPVLPLPAPRDPIARAFGWEALTSAVESTAGRADDSTHARTWLGADRYQEASEIAFHDAAHPTVFALNLASRPNQYDLWTGFPDTAARGDDLVLALDDRQQPDPVITRLRPFFTSVARGPAVALRRGSGVVATRRLWLLSGYSGGWPSPATGR